MLGSHVLSLFVLFREFPYVFVYCLSCRYLAQPGLRQLGLPMSVINLDTAVLFFFVPVPDPWRHFLTERGSEGGPIPTAGIFVVP